MGKILVIGSLGMDFVTYVDEVPAEGKTVLANRSERIPGGEGANQAYAAGRLLTYLHQLLDKIEVLTKFPKAARDDIIDKSERGDGNAGRRDAGGQAGKSDDETVSMRFQTYSRLGNMFADTGPVDNMDINRTVW